MAANCAPAIFLILDVPFAKAGYFSGKNQAMFRLLFVLTTLYALPASAGSVHDTIAVKTRGNYHLPEGVERVYTIEYSISLKERVMPDSTVFTDSLLTKRKECNYIFSRDGYLLNFVADSFDDGGRELLRKEDKYYYDGHHLAGIVHVENNKMVDSMCIGYNRKGEINEKTMYDRRGRKTGRVQYFYRSGKVFNIKLRRQDDMLQQFIRLEYDDLGRLKEKEFKNSDLQYSSAVKYDYTDADGNVRVNEYRYANPQKIAGMTTRIYDGQKRLVHLSVADSNKRIVESRTIEYNEWSLPASELVFTTTKVDYTFSYEYDDRGYWKTRIKYEGAIPVSRIHRVVEYFKNGE